MRADQPPEVLAMRLACLDERRDALRALTDVFAHADTSVVVQAVNAVRELPSLDRCDGPKLSGAMSAASEPAQRARVASLRASLAEVKALSDTGQWPAARRKLAPLVDAARAVGHGGLLAEVLDRRAWLEERSGEMRAAAATYEEALWLAIAAHRDDVALACAAQLVAVFGYHFNDGAAGERWDRLGQALHGRLGSGHERVAAWLIHNHGLLRLRQGDVQGALADARAALRAQAAGAARPASGHRRLVDVDRRHAGPGRRSRRGAGARRTRRSTSFARHSGPTVRCSVSC